MEATITPKQIDDILKHLPALETKESCIISGPVRKVGNTIEIGCVHYSSGVTQLMNSLHDSGCGLVFDWTAWQGEAGQYVSHPELLRSADILKLQKLLTLHIRKERFFEGHFGTMVDSGHIKRILERLKELRAQMGGPE
jgi:hypothetical protein